jgi:5'-nucleotidase
MDKPVILITNDDGVNARGIRELTRSLKGLGKLIVFAPDGPRSGMSGAITSTVPLTFELLEQDEDVTVYSCSGMPVDCVKLAIHSGIKPDLLVSGINQGGNMSVCVHYSGTMGAAIEGCIMDIPSIGLSLSVEGKEADFSESCRLGRIVIDYVLKEGLPQGTYLNLNVPNIPQVKGIKVCRQADARFTDEYDLEEDAEGKPVYWLTGSLRERRPVCPDSDIVALNEGYASLVPCKIDVTDYAYMEKLEILAK